MRKSISVSEAKDEWVKVKKDLISDKQRRFFFAVGAARVGKDDDGYIEVNYSKIPIKQNESVDVNASYDSIRDLIPHKNLVNKAMDIMIKELSDRAKNHDNSKLFEPEKSGYDKYVPMLKEVKYGSKEYEKIRDAMYQEATKFHFQNNRHHPEHFENGILGMNLIDILEMLCDWYAASKRSDTTIVDGMKFNKERFHIDDAIYQILLNTVRDYF